MFLTEAEEQEVTQIPWRNLGHPHVKPWRFLFITNASPDINIVTHTPHRDPGELYLHLPHHVLGSVQQLHDDASDGGEEHHHHQYTPTLKIWFEGKQPLLSTIMFLCGLIDIHSEILWWQLQFLKLDRIVDN